ncbi:MAG: glycosyltransferase family 4 protein [Anaerolineales bacterium]|nr:MAG: glycosyltransferase family 4 protein [Anaerolineales bacterium]
MRICFIADARSIHTKRWVQYFLERGNDILVFSRYETPIPGTKVLPWPKVISENWSIRKFELLRNAWLFRSMVRGFKPDIVHIHYIYNNITNLLWYWGVKNLFVSPWGSDIINDYSAEIEGSSFYRRFLFRQARVITATSHFLADVARHYTDKEVHVVPFGVDCQVFRPTERINMTSVVTLAFVKHLRVKYGPEYLIRAMSLIVAEYSRTKLLIVGSGELRIQLEALTERLGLTRNISFLGAIEHRQLPELLRNVDMFVMPSIWEGFGVAAVEAQAMEIPVIATKVGGIPEIVRDGITGILVEPRNPEQLATAIIELIENPEKRKEMGKEGRKYVLSRYRWEDNAALMDDLYKSVLESPGGKR